MNLTIDIGNSSIKTGLFNEDKLIELNKFLSLHELNEFLENHKALPTAVCSVRFEKDEIISNVPKLSSALFLNAETKTPLSLAYDTPNTLGMDRLAAAIGANELLPGKRILVIDLGTCITYDLIEGSTFMGGMIAPGMHMRFRAMHEFTAKLPLVNPSEPTFYMGKSTAGSMNNGVIRGITGEIEHHISQLMLKNAGLEVIMTGGDALLFESKIKSDIFVSLEIVLLGLNGVLKYNA